MKKSKEKTKKSKKYFRDGTLSTNQESIQCSSYILKPKPEKGYKLIICLHEVHNPTAEDAESKNIAKLSHYVDKYKPGPGVMFVLPHWNIKLVRGWEGHQSFFIIEKLITDLVLLDAVDPNRVYLLSEGSACAAAYEIVFRAPYRFAGCVITDRPNSQIPLKSIGNVVFAFCNNPENPVSKKDSSPTSDVLEVSPVAKSASSPCYQSIITTIAAVNRDFYPDKLLWKQPEFGYLRDEYWWLAVPKNESKHGALIDAEREGSNTFRITTTDVKTVIIRLSWAYVNFNEKITIYFNKKVVLSSKLSPSKRTVEKTLNIFDDPYLIYDGEITVTEPPK